MKGWNAVVLFIVLSAGLIVANLYYCQPLIPLIAHDFHISDSEAGRISWLTQAGYAAGLLFIVPLGDIFERKKQLIVCAVAASVFMLLAAVSPTFTMLQISCVLIGAASVVPQLLVPYGAILSSEENRVKVTGIVMSGLLIGILASISLSGVVGSFAGWRIIFLLGAGFCIAVAGGAFLLLPRSKPSLSIPYTALMKSVFHYFNTQVTLRIASVLSAISFAVVSSFWVTLVFFLTSPPFNYAPWKIGLFGLAGAAGVLAGSVAWGFTGISRNNMLIFCGLICEFLGFIAFLFAYDKLAFLIAGILLLNVGHQLVQIVNQVRIYYLIPEVRNRLSTVFMITYFIGGAAGAALGIALWNAGGWMVYCSGGIVIILINLAIFYITKRAVL